MFIVGHILVGVYYKHSHCIDLYYIVLYIAAAAGGWTLHVAVITVIGRASAPVSTQ